MRRGSDPGRDGFVKRFFSRFRREVIQTPTSLSRHFFGPDPVEWAYRSAEAQLSPTDRQALLEDQLLFGHSTIIIQDGIPRRVPPEDVRAETRPTSYLYEPGAGL